MPRCLRCKDVELDVSRHGDFSLFGCSKCFRAFVSGEDGSLHEKWPGPLSLALYDIRSQPLTQKEVAILAEQWCNTEIPGAQSVFGPFEKGRLDFVLSEIRLELEDPTQRVSKLFPDQTHSEEELRRFLGTLLEEITRRRGRREDPDLVRQILAERMRFDGRCSVCGKPGSLQQLPEAPVSSIFCEDHVPSFSLSPAWLLPGFGILLGLGWLVYTRVL